MRRRKMIAMATATLLVAGAMMGTSVNAQHKADSRCELVSGYIVSALVGGSECASPIGLCTRGHFFGPLGGDFTFTATSIVPTIDTPFTGVVAYTGDIVLTTKRGDLMIKDSGGFNATPGGTGDSTSVSTIISGTGRAEGTTGRLRICGAITPEGGGMAGYEGEVCRPHKR